MSFTTKAKEKGVLVIICMKCHSIYYIMWVVDFQAATDEPVNIPEPFKADYTPEKFTEPFNSKGHCTHSCQTMQSVLWVLRTHTLEALPQYIPDELSIPSILIDSDIDITSIQTNSETFVLSPDLSAAAASDVKLYLGANLCTLQAISMLMSWFSTFPGLGKSSFTHLFGILQFHPSKG